MRLGSFFLTASFLIANIVLAASSALAQECRAPSQRMTEAQLVFGRNIGGKLGVSEKSWARFLASEISPRFPDGLTVMDAAGQWRDPARKRLVREPSKIVMVVAREDIDFQKKIDAIVDAYKRRFHQQAVGVIMRPACVSF